MSRDKSILFRMEEQGRPAPRVTLEGSERSDKATDRYEILGELARGGVGVVHRGRDNDLGRDVALKVLRDKHLESPELVQRFVEEAQIGGQLQHPGIVPVYELGLRADKRPYFAMKLVKGETLAARLAAGGAVRRALLAVFREVCRTMAYAHARGVIHRDLKPSNVMIGNFGEVQVVDWGFAKVVRKGGLADERLARKAERDTTMISTVRSRDGSEPSVAGSVLGTPAYMPPEQALGRVEDLDEKGDLFSLGAILCEILTGKPPYTGDDRMADAAQALLEPAYRRLDECGAADRLVKLAKRCLQPLPKDRPPGAQVLADEVAAYLTSAEGRAHRAQVRSLKAGARADEQRRARRLTTLVGTSVVAALAIAAGAYFWIDAGRTEREKERRTAIEAALQDASRLRAAKRWPEAVAAAERAADLGYEGSLADRIRTEADEAAEVAQRRAEERQLLTDLEEARALGADHELKVIDAAYEKAVRKLWPSMEVDVQRLKESEHAPAFAAAFDAWASWRKAGDKDWRRLDTWAREIDPASNPLRDAIASKDADALLALAEKAEVDALPATMVVHLAEALRDDARERRAALRLLERAQRRHPDDFWVHMSLARTAAEVHGKELAVRHGLAALAARPESLEARHSLGIFLERSGDLQGALDTWNDALKRHPEWVHGRKHIADAMARLGHARDEALAVLKEGIAQFPEDPEGHTGLAEFQRLHLKKYRAAAASNRKALKLDPENSVALNNLGLALEAAGEFDEAIRALEKAIALAPHADCYCNLGSLYFHRASLTSPANRSELRKGIGLLRKALERNADHVTARVNLGNALTYLGKHREAAVELEKAVRSDPTDAETRYHLAVQLTNLRRWDEAIAHLKKANELDPKNWRAWYLLGRALAGKGDEDAAAEAYHKVAELEPSQAFLVGLGLGDQLGRDEEAIVQFRRAVEMNPGHVQARYALGTSLRRIGKIEEAVGHIREALDRKPDHAEAWCNLGWCYRDLGRWSEAVDAFRKGHELGTARPYWNYPSGLWLKRTEQMAALAPRLDRVLAEKTVELTPVERADMAEMLRVQRRFDLCIRFYREAFRADPALAAVGKRYRYEAIWAAAAAGKPYRAQALEWCRSLVEGLRQEYLETDPASLYRKLTSLMKNRELAPIRDAGDLSDEWKKFWADVAALRERAAK